MPLSFLEEIGLVSAPSPAMQFIGKRLKSQPPGDTRFNDHDKHTLIDLVASDIPLDPRTRSLIARELRRLYFPNAERERRERRKWQNALIEEFQLVARMQGMTAKEADYEIVRSIGKSLGIKSIDALRKRMQRARKNRRTKN